MQLIHYTFKLVHLNVRPESKVYESILCQCNAYHIRGDIGHKMIYECFINTYKINMTMFDIVELSHLNM